MEEGFGGNGLGIMTGTGTRRRETTPMAGGKDPARRVVRRVRVWSPAVLVSACLILAGVLGGCGGSPAPRPEEELIVDRALNAALQGEKAEFVTLVAPSFLEQARAEMPDVDDETLGGILIAGFLEDIPFHGIREAAYSINSAGDKADVYVTGLFVGPDGQEIKVDGAEALRIPIIREGGSWYLDFLDL